MTKTSPKPPSPTKRTKTTTKPAPAPATPAKKTTTRTRPARGTAKAAKGLLAAASAPVVGAATELPLDAIDPTHFTNPRGEVDEESPEFAELVQSIVELDVLQPVVVGPALCEGGRHPLLAGWRRYHAARAAGRGTIPVRQVTEIREAKDALAAAIAENVARQDMSPLAEARAIDALMQEHGLTQVAAGKQIGMSERTVRERLRLLAAERDVSPVVAQAMSDGVVPVRAAAWVTDLGTFAPEAAEDLARGVSDGRLEAHHLVSPRDGRYANVLRGLPGIVEYPRDGWGSASAIAGSDAPEDRAVRKAYSLARKPLKDGVWCDTRITLTATELADAIHAGAAWTAPDDSVWLRRGERLTTMLHDAIARVEKRAKTAVRAKEERVAEVAARHDDAQAAQRRNDEVAEHARRGNAELARVALRAAVTSQTSKRLAFFETLALKGCTCGADLTAVLGDLLEEHEPTGDVDELIRVYAIADHLDKRGVAPASNWKLARLREFSAAARELLVSFTPPARAARVLAARQAYEAATAERDTLLRKLRVLAELAEDHGDYAAVHGALPTRHLVETVQWHRNPYGTSAFTPELREALVAAGLITVDDDADTVAITQAGRDLLAADLPPVPEFEDIDPPGPPAPTAPDRDVAREATPAVASITNTSGARKALEEIAKTPGITVPELADRLKVKQNTLYRILPALAKEGQIVKTGRGWHPAEA